MVDTYIDGSIGVVVASVTKEFKFLVVKNAPHIGLPQSDIEALGLKRSLFTAGRPDSGPKPAYEAAAHFEKCYIELDVRPEPIPTVGDTMLRDLGFEVDLENGHIANPAQPLKIYRGIMPTMMGINHPAKKRPNDEIGSQFKL